MAQNTPLDSLTTVSIVAADLISLTTDNIAGSGCEGDHDDDLDMMSWVSELLWRALASHLPGVKYETSPFRILTYPATYSDGSPTVEMIVLDDGTEAKYMPRHHGDRQEFVNLFNELHKPRPRLRVVESDN